MIKRSSCFQLHVLFALCGSFLLLILAGPTMVEATTYYVALTGKDSNAGTSTSAPFRTFARAVKPLRPGDTLYIRAGVWTERIDLTVNNTSGTSSGYIKIAGYPGEKVTIRYAEATSPGYGPIKAWGTRGYLRFENLILDGINMPNKVGWQIRSGNHHFILRNLEIKNFRSHGLGIEGNDHQVINCSIHDQISVSGSTGERWYGIYYSKGNNALFQGNKIYNNPGGGLHLYAWGPMYNARIIGNTIHRNNKLASSTVGGIIVYGTSNGTISSTQIYNNLVYKNGTSSSGTASGISIANGTTGTKVYNNTVYGNKSNGVVISSGSSSTVVQNNIMYGNGKMNYYSYTSSTKSTNNHTTDPKFVSTSSDNFQLQSSSPAANKGVKLSSVPNDYRNVARPKGTTHDIGAYENY